MWCRIVLHIKCGLKLHYRWSVSIAENGKLQRQVRFSSFFLDFLDFLVDFSDFQVIFSHVQSQQ